MKYQLLLFLFGFFSVRLLSVLRDHSVFSSPPQRPITSDCEGFLYQILSITLFSYLNSWERAIISLFQCWVLNKGTTWYHFLVWLGPWLRIEPPTLKASTLPLGFRGGGIFVLESMWILHRNLQFKNNAFPTNLSNLVCLYFFILNLVCFW